MREQVCRRSFNQIPDTVRLRFVETGGRGVRLFTVGARFLRWGCVPGGTPGRFPGGFQCQRARGSLLDFVLSTASQGGPQDPIPGAFCRELLFWAFFCTNPRGGTPRAGLYPKLMVYTLCLTTSDLRDFPQPKIDTYRFTNKKKAGWTKCTPHLKNPKQHRFQFLRMFFF